MEQNSQLKKDYLIIATFILASFALEVSLFLFLGFGVLPKYFLFDFGFILIISGLLFITPAYKTKVAIAITILSLQAIINCVNVTLFNIFGDIFTFDMLTLGNEAAAAFSLKFIQWWSVIVMALILTAAIVAFVFFLKSGNRKPNYSQSISLFLVLTFIFSFACGTGIIKLQKNYLETAYADINNEYFESDSYLYRNLNVKIAALKKFGTFGLYMTDIYQSLGIQSAAQIKAEQDETKNYINSAKTVTDLGLTAGNNYFGISKTNNIITIMVESFEWFAIDPELTPNLYWLYTNALNFQNFYARNKTNVSEGIGILGSYSKDTQFTTFYRANSDVGSLNLPFSLPNMLKSQAETEGRNVTTAYFHDYYGYFYGRNTVLPSFGFDNCTFLEDLITKAATDPDLAGKPQATDKPTEFSDFFLDSVLFKEYISQIAPANTDQFYSHVTTVSMHGGYDFSRPRLEAEGYYDQVLSNLTMAAPTGDEATDNDYTITSSIKKWLADNGYTLPSGDDLEKFINYKAAALDTDKAIGILLDYLRTNTDKDGNALIDVTTLIVYGDHNTYMTSLSNAMKNLPETDLFTTELYRLPLMIYDKATVNQYKSDTATAEKPSGTNIITKSATTFSIVPTVMFMHGIDYKPDFYQGASLFTENSDTGFISIIGGIIDENFFSYDTIDILYSKLKKSTPQEIEIYNKALKHYQKINVAYYEKQIHLERIYKYNMFKK